MPSNLTHYELPQFLSKETKKEAALLESMSGLKDMAETMVPQLQNMAETMAPQLENIANQFNLGGQ